MSVPQVNPSDLHDAAWPFREGQLVQSVHGYFYTVEGCELDSYDNQWWIKIFNEILDLTGEVRVGYLRKPNVKHARSTFVLVGGIKK